VIRNHKSRRYQAVLNHSENKRGVLQVKCRFGEDGVTGQQRAVDSGRNFQRPSVMPIIAVGEGDQKPVSAIPVTFWRSSCVRTSRAGPQPIQQDEGTAGRAVCERVRVVRG